MRSILAVVVMASLGCATAPPVDQTGPSPQPSQAAAPAPCNPGHSILNASLWTQQAAEYDAVALSTYAAARRALDAALADPSVTGAAEETSNDPAQPPAIILDLDETALDNTAFEARVIRAGKTYDSKTWKEWTSEGAALAVPGAAEFLAYAKSRGVTPFYITNRDMDEEPGTLRNLESLGFPLQPGVDTVLQRGEKGWTTSDKSPRRAHVAAGYRVLLLVGDDLNDFTDASTKTAAERDEIIERTREWWGTRWFILPNPMYGSWERASIGAGGTPCEQLQRKVEVLR
jgi:5'-nucleotidase (lipoprotein e(P4) family)